MYPKFTNRIWSLHALLQPFKLFTKMLHVSTLVNTQSIWDSLNADHSSQYFALLTECDVTSGCGFKKLHDYIFSKILESSGFISHFDSKIAFVGSSCKSVRVSKHIRWCLSFSHASYTQCCQEAHTIWIESFPFALNMCWRHEIKRPNIIDIPCTVSWVHSPLHQPNTQLLPRSWSGIAGCVFNTKGPNPHQSHSSRHKWAHRNRVLTIWRWLTKMLHMTQCPTSSDHSKSFKDPSHLKLITKYVWCPIVTFSDPPGITAGYGHSTSGLIHASAELHTRKRALSHGVLATPANLSIWRWEAQLKQRFSHWQRVTYESLRLNDTLPHTPQKHT